MSFWAYLYLLRASCRKFFNSKKALATKQNDSKYINEMNVECRYLLQQKCQKAAIEIQNIGNFSHWPVAKAKENAPQNSLVYLDIKRNKRASVEQLNKRTKKTSIVAKQVTVAIKSGTVKKLPNT